MPPPKDTAAIEASTVEQEFVAARTLAQQSRYDEARTQYRKIQDAAKDDRTRALSRAAIAELDQRLEEALLALSSVVSDALYPLKHIGLFYQASVLRTSMETKETVGIYESIIDAKREPWASWSKNNLADVYEALGAEGGSHAPKYRKRALELYNELAEQADDVSNSHIDLYNLTCVLIRRGDYVEAGKRFRDSMRQMLRGAGYEDALPAEKISDAAAWRDVIAKVVQFDPHMTGILAREVGTMLFRLAATTSYEKVSEDVRNAELWAGDGQKPAWDGLSDEGKKLIAAACDWWETALGALSNAASLDEGDSERAALVNHKLHLATRLLKEAESPDALDGRGLARIKPGTNEFRFLGWLPIAAQSQGGYSTAEERIFTKVLAKSRTAYEEYASQYDPDADFDAQLLTLRGWSSSVPLVSHDVPDCKGGGYLIRWGGKGIVIDPGMDFLLNLRRCGHHIGDVDAVVVSHNHPDHNLDLVAFDDIRYELSKRRNADSGERDWSYALVMDEDTEAQFRRRFPTHSWPGHREVSSFDLSSYKQHFDSKSTAKPYRPPVIDLTPLKLPFKIHYFRAVHSEDVPHAVGFRLECLKEDGSAGIVIGYSADTEFKPYLCNEHHLGGSDILILHISQPDSWELMDNNGQKWDKHLGYRGVERLLRGLKRQPRLTLLGEFWAGLGDFRLEITEGLRLLTGVKSILPTSIGMCVDLPEGRVRCSSCKRLVPSHEVSVCPAYAELGPLGYLCFRCMSLRGGSS